MQAWAYCDIVSNYLKVHCGDFQETQREKEVDDVQHRSLLGFELGSFCVTYLQLFIVYFRFWLFCFLIVSIFKCVVRRPWVPWKAPYKINVLLLLLLLLF